MKYSLATIISLCFWLVVDVFGFVPIQSVDAFYRKRPKFEESSESNINPDRPKNMVDTKTFVAAVQTLEGGTTTDDGSSASNTPYAIGKININLSIMGTPGLDLAEAPGLVLVSGVSGNAAEVGIQTGDTIVSIGAANGSFQQETKGMNLEDTASALMAAANHAVENGSTEVELEINRLVKLAYSD
eukprot:scaffold21455_cov116-Cylindrotheca_fusiformis.AAC.18